MTRLQQHILNEGKNDVSLTISMNSETFKELKSELNIKQTMGQIDPKRNLADKLSILFVGSVDRGKKSVRISK